MYANETLLGNKEWCWEPDDFRTGYQTTIFSKWEKEGKKTLYIDFKQTPQKKIQTKPYKFSMPFLQASVA